jgi:hypothetical protein
MGVEEKYGIMVFDVEETYSLSCDGAVTELRSVGRISCWRSAVVILHP